MAVATKGWSEERLMWEIPFQNLMLYSLCLPSIGEDGEPEQSVAPVDMFSYFDSMGKG